MIDSEQAPLLIILHGLLSAGADASEKTIDAAIKGAALLETKLEALQPAKESKDDEKPADPPV